MAASKLLANWEPSPAAIALIRKNGISDELIKKSVQYLKSQTVIKHIDDVEGYSNWNSFFIVFCIKAKKENAKPR